MKKILFCILATLPLAYCMTGCSNDTDYGGFSYFIWANDSDHRITLSVAREYGELVIENEIIEPGESFESERVDGAIAYCPPPSSYIRYVEVVFEDGTKAIYISRGISRRAIPIIIRGRTLLSIGIMRRR